MNQILLSFLCGAAFIGGATTVIVLVVMANSMSSKAGRKELYDYWKTSIDQHAKQLEILSRIAVEMEIERDRKDAAMRQEPK